jgi:hypothetical protein
MRSVTGIGAAAAIMLAGSLTWSTASAYEISCESKGGKAKRCMSAGRPEVRLDRQLSKNPCVLGESWGVDDEGLWVDRGCKAVFEISGLQKSSGGGDGTPKCPYGAGSNECEYWQDGLRAGREDATSRRPHRMRSERWPRSGSSVASLHSGCSHDLEFVGPGSDGHAPSATFPPGCDTVSQVQPDSLELTACWPIIGRSSREFS